MERAVLVLNISMKLIPQKHLPGCDLSTAVVEGGADRRPKIESMEYDLKAAAAATASEAVA